MQGVTEANSSNFDQIIASAEVPVVVDFYATWCGPCRQLSPILERLAQDLSGQVQVVKVNADEQMEIAATYGVSGLPTVLFFRKGEPVYRHVGIMSLGDLKRKVDEVKI